MIRAHTLNESSTFLGQTCALCKQEFHIGDAIVICPADGSRHHVRCWQANGNRCTAYGCRGEGAIGSTTSRPPGEPPRRAAPRRPRVITQEPENRPAATARPIPKSPGSKVRTLPAGSLGCARFCLLIAIAIAIVLFALGCFGLWAIADYLMLNVWDMPYRVVSAPGLLLLNALIGG
jgi:hypothetical protein